MEIAGSIPADAPIPIAGVDDNWKVATPEGESTLHSGEVAQFQSNGRMARRLQVKALPTPPSSNPCASVWSTADVESVRPDESSGQEVKENTCE